MLQKFRKLVVMMCLLLALVFGLVTARVMVAGVSSPDLSGSSISVDRSVTTAGGTVKYTVVISNSGGTVANGVLVTNTLPAELNYQTGSFNSDTMNATTLGYGDSGNVITWTGNVDSLGAVSLSYTADVTDSVMVDDIIQNTVQISGTGELLEPTVPTSVVEEYTRLMPIAFNTVPAPVMNPLSGPTASSNSWTATWNVPAPEVTGYELQEAPTINFNNPTTIDVGNDTSRDFSYSASPYNLYCYRVRAFVDDRSSGWSNVECAAGNYFDDFVDTGSGWTIRQEDSDDTENSSYYDGGRFVVKIGGRWDYALASPLAQAPEPPYAIETRIRFDDTVDNLHGYGIIFGGNWYGDPCPSNDLDNCFTHYYRFLVVWYGPLNSFRVQLKRIDYNDPIDNIGRGVTLVDFKDIPVGNSKGYNVWRIEVDEDGSMRVYLNGSSVASTKDSSYISSPYFGIMASSDEYLGTEPYVDWFQATKR
ncbi:MAG: DUF11 domain-containing protein [Anaerolineales bacterium]|nr:DUF11 domain-containing protein [Anaerolineales bacterium]